jgi:HD-like signal output (HDOD) protein
VKRILFVDDEQAVLDGMRRMLRAEQHRWEMRFVTSGEAALRLCETTPVDVVVSDIRMPGMDGVTLLGHVKRLYPDAARLILSGYAEMELASRAVGVAYRVISKPCDGMALRAMIERMCVLQDALSTPQIRRVIGSIGTLPSHSKTCRELAQAVQDPATSLAQIAEIVGRDVAMSAKVLQLANAGFFGLAQSVTSLDQAVAYLGMNTISNLVLASESFQIFHPDGRIPAAFYDSIQKHAHAAALIAGSLPLDRKGREIAIMAALLHDIGTLALASRMPGQMSAILALMNDRGCMQYEAETELLGTTHAEVGAYLLGLWGIDHLIVEAIAHHHHPNRVGHDGLDCAAAVYLANLLAHEIDAHPGDLSGDELREIDRDHLEQLGIWREFPRFRADAVSRV